jgi:hypothetical protein
MLVSTAVSISMDISSIGPGTFHAWEVLELNSIFFQKKKQSKAQSEAFNPSMVYGL